MRLKETIVGILMTILFFTSCKSDVHFGFLELNHIEHSMTISDSKKADCFVSVYIPEKKELKLVYHDETIHFDTAWVENSMEYKSISLMRYTKKKVNDYSLIVPFKKSQSDKFLFDLVSIKGLNNLSAGIEENRKVLSSKSISDTILLRIEEKNPIDSIGWQNGLLTDTIVFIKQK